MKYRPTRAIEASLIDFIKEKLIEDSWKDINVEKSFIKAYKVKLPVIVVRVSSTTFNKLEIGTNSINRSILIIIDIFGSDDSNKSDLTDWLLAKLKNGFPYYEYHVEKDESGVKVTQKIKKSHVFIRRYTATNVNLGLDRSELDEHDRYRAQITLEGVLNYIE